MPGNKYLQVGTSGFPEEQASSDASTGAPDAGEIVALDSGGKISPTMLPVASGDDALTLTAGEALTAGNLVYVNASGQAMKADNTAIAKAAVGFTLTSVASSASVIVYFEGQLPGLAGLTPGAAYFLGVAGAVTLTAPTATNSIVQYVGRATSATSLNFEGDIPIKRI